MAQEFTGKASPLDNDGLQAALDTLGVRAAEFWAVLQVETSGSGFLQDRRPKILFERHVFSRLTHHQFDAQKPSISNPQPGGYGPDGAPQYDRLAQAIGLNRTAALQSASWGLGQVMGYNAEQVGFRDVEAMVQDMAATESAQVAAMARFIDSAGLSRALRSQDWARFAAGYNGPNYRINNYDTRLAAAHAALERGLLPDLDVRAGQTYLFYLGFDPHGIDGVMGRLTRSAMNDFQASRHLPITQFFDPDTLNALRTSVS